MTAQFRTALLAAGFLGLSATVASAAPATVDRDSNLRGGPGTSHRVEAVVPAGAPIDVTDCQGGWCAAVYGREQGFVACSLVDFRGGPGVVGRSVVGGPRYGYYGYYDPYPRRYSYYPNRRRDYHSPSVGFWLDF